MHPFFVAFDIALIVLSVRSIAVLGAKAPWTSLGWAGTVGYAIAAALEYSLDGTHATAALVAYAFIGLLTIAFVVAGVRDEPQAEPWWWPSHVGLTRAQRRSGTP
jgi:hypothetical protein